MNTAEQKVADLLKPRYRMKINMPCSSHKKGEIIYDNGASIVTHRSNVDVLCSAYPDCYEPVEWWEEREEKDMPEYVRFADDTIVKVLEYQKGVVTENGQQPIRMILPNNNYAVTANVMCFFEPATETEYQQYLSTQK